MDTSTLWYYNEPLKPESYLKDDMIHCGECSAIYNMNAKFIRVRYHEGTNGNYDEVGKCQDYRCPICNRDHSHFYKE